MRRLIKLTSLALMVACFTGCHHWAKKRVAAASYADCCDPCGSGATVVAPINTVAGPPVVSKMMPVAGSAQFP
jgi:hypothetical protein